MLICGGTLSFLSYQKGLLSGDLILIAKLFIGLIIIITIGLLIFLILKFRIILIDDSKAEVFYPFRLNRIRLDFEEIKAVKLENWIGQNGTVYRKVLLKGKKTSLIFTDRELENFDSILESIPNSISDKSNFDFKQAKSNLSTMQFMAIVLSGFLIYLIYYFMFEDSINETFMIFLIVDMVLLFASIKRIVKYRNSIKKVHKKTKTTMPSVDWT